MVINLRLKLHSPKLLDGKGGGLKMLFVKKAISHEPATNVEREIFHKMETRHVDPNIAFPNFGIEDVHCGRHLSSETATSSVLMQKVEKIQTQVGRDVEERDNIVVARPLLYQIRERLRGRFPRLFREAEVSTVLF